MTARQAAPKPPRPFRPPTHVRYWEAGYDVAMLDVGRLVLQLRQADAADDDVLEAVLSMVQLRMMTGSENPVELLTENDRA